jgi:transcriptional regulator with XRE-family HTH domain
VSSKELVFLQSRCKPTPANGLSRPTSHLARKRLAAQDVGMAWHDKLSAALLDSGYTPERLVEVFGCHVNTAKNYMDGKTQPRYDMLYALCRLAGVSADWVLDDDRPLIGDLQTDNPRGTASPSDFEVVDDPDMPRGSRGRVMVVLSLGPPLPPTMVRDKIKPEFWRELPGSRRVETEHDLSLIRDAKRGHEGADVKGDEPVAEPGGASPPGEGAAPDKGAGRKSARR